MKAAEFSRKPPKELVPIADPLFGLWEAEWDVPRNEETNTGLVEHRNAMLSQCWFAGTWRSATIRCGVSR